MINQIQGRGGSYTEDKGPFLMTPDNIAGAGVQGRSVQCIPHFILLNFIVSSIKKYVKRSKLVSSVRSQQI